jgi:hypothetical protein
MDDVAKHVTERLRVLDEFITNRLRVLYDYLAMTNEGVIMMNPEEHRRKIREAMESLDPEVLVMVSEYNNDVFVGKVREICHRKMDQLSKNDLYLIIGVLSARLSPSQADLPPPGRRQ